MLTITELHIIPVPGHIWSSYEHHGQYTIDWAMVELIGNQQAMSGATCEVRQSSAKEELL